MPTAPTRLTPTSASAGSAPTRKAGASASAGSAPTRKAGSSATAGAAPDRLASVSAVTVPGADASFLLTYAEITLAEHPLSYGIGVGMFVVSDDFPAGTTVLTLEETKVTLSQEPTANSTGEAVVFTRVPPAPTRKSS